MWVRSSAGRARKGKGAVDVDVESLVDVARVRGRLDGVAAGVDEEVALRFAMFAVLLVL